VKKAFGLLAALVVSTAALTPAKADGPFPFNLFRGDPKVVASGIVAGGAATGAYFAIKPRHHMHKRFGLTRNAAAGVTTVGCMVFAPMLAAAVVDITEARELTSREALGLSSDCIIPFLGCLFRRASGQGQAGQAARALITIPVRTAA
jgi:hypothetical protein